MVTAYREVCIDQRPSAPAMLSTRPRTRPGRPKDLAGIPYIEPTLTELARHK
jgi:hypothetical protein